MDNNIKLLKKIQNCRAAIKASDLKKLGYNTYSDYNYYTPEQVDKLVYDVCVSEKLFTKFDLKRDQNGLYGELAIIDLETGESELFVASTEIPKITATNASQQMGGCMTFSERYLKQFAFSIVNNDLDFDAQPPQKNKSNGNKNSGNKPGNEQPKLPWLNEGTEEYRLAVESIKQKLRKPADIYKKFAVNKKVRAILEAL